MSVGDDRLAFEARMMQAPGLAALEDGATAVAHLNALRNAAPSPVREADALYTLWETGGDAAHTAAALALYRDLLAQTPDYSYRQRIEGLTSIVNPDAAR